MTNTITNPIPISTCPIEHIQNNKGISPINPIPIKMVPKHPLLEFSSDFEGSDDFKIKYPIGRAKMATKNPMPTSEPLGKPKSGSFGSYLGPAKEFNAKSIVNCNSKIRLFINLI